MTFGLVTPAADRMDEVVGVLREWQRDDAPIQLHPGDIGWLARQGPDGTAAALRTWQRDGNIVAIGMLDGPDVLRMTIAPEAWHDADLAAAIVTDVETVLPAGEAAIEVPDGTALRTALTAAGWRDGDAWSPLRLDLDSTVVPVGLQTRTVGPGQLSDFLAVHQSAWGSPSFTGEKWHAMASGPAFADGRCLLGYDGDGIPVAGITVWSAGSGRPGLIEPLGVHVDHRRNGYAREICLAAAAQLRTMGASGVLVCTPSSLTSAVATYVSAGFERLPQRLDLVRGS